ncbi:MAG: hypothetical protein J7K82_05235 [Thermoproteales archaeon]|nr:hypothetical protein [Thermoproteales archaeon]
MSRLITYSIKIPKELREKMEEIDINWAEYIRKAIRIKIAEIERKKAAEILDNIRGRAKKVTTDEIVSWIREDRQR